MSLYAVHPYPGPRGFRSRRRDETREKEVVRETLVMGDADLTIMLQQVSQESINKQPISTHLSVKRANQSTL